MIKKKVRSQKPDFRNQLTPQERYFNMYSNVPVEQRPESMQKLSIQYRGTTIINGKKYKVFN